jgi:4'-phosphopantetheinyl transferase
MEALVFHTYIDHLDQPLTEDQLQRMPYHIASEIRQYRKNDDQVRLMAGKLLLLAGIKHCQRPTSLLMQYTQDEMGKPYIEDFFSFNITHSGNVVACAVLMGEGLIGIDCERKRNIDVPLFTKQFSPAEMTWILSSSDPQEQFFEAWTMKESVMKADGRGMRIPLHSIRIYPGPVTIDDRDCVWNVYPIDMDKNHPAHLCSNVSIQKFHTQFFTIDQLWNLTL